MSYLTVSFHFSETKASVTGGSKIGLSTSTWFVQAKKTSRLISINLMNHCSRIQAAMQKTSAQDSGQRWLPSHQPLNAPTCLRTGKCCQCNRTRKRTQTNNLCDANLKSRQGCGYAWVLGGHGKGLKSSLFNFISFCKCKGLKCA